MFNYLPLYYTFHSRIKTNAERLSWIVIYPAFVFFVSYQLGGDASRTAVGIISVMYIYEVGYLYNDFWTIRYETEPTIRCGGKASHFYSNFLKHILFRLVVGYSLGSSVFFIYGDATLLAMLSLILVAYVIHNTIRSRINIVSYVSLVSLRYLSPVFYVLDAQAVWIVLLSFPICRTIEHACKKKYKLARLRCLIKDFDKFRVYYYSLNLLFLLIIYIYDRLDATYLFFIAYFFVFRLCSFIVRDRVSRNKHKSY